MNTENQKSTEPTLTPEQKEVLALVKRAEELVKSKAPGINFLFVGVVAGHTAFCIGGGDLSGTASALYSALLRDPMLLAAVMATAELASERTQQIHIKPTTEA